MFSQANLDAAAALDALWSKNVSHSAADVQTMLQASLGMPFFVHAHSVRRLGAAEARVGHTVYGYHRAPRTAGKDALALIVALPLAAATEVPRDLRLAWALVHAAQSVRWLARDLALIVVDTTAAGDGGALGLRAWAEAYHWHSGVPAETLRGALGARIDERAGELTAALQLSLGDSGCARTLALQVVGADGALPNLDLMNVVARCAEAVGLQLAPTASLALPPAAAWLYGSESLRAASAMLGFARDQLRLTPAAAAGELVRFNVPALALVALPDARGRAACPGDVLAVGRALHDSLRALSSLLERLHQSFRLYWLAGPMRFSSYGEHTYAVLLIAAAAWLAAAGAMRAEPQALVQLPWAAALAVALHVAAAAGSWALPHAAELLVAEFGVELGCALCWLALPSLALAPVLAVACSLCARQRGLGAAVRTLALYEAGAVTLCLSLANFALALAFGLAATGLAALMPVLGRLRVLTLCLSPLVLGVLAGMAGEAVEAVRAGPSLVIVVVQLVLVPLHAALIVGISE